MINPSKIEELARQLNDNLPPGVKALGEDADRKLKQVLQSQLNKLDMVSREDFDVQTQVLLRTREKLSILEARVAELEKQLAEKDQDTE